MFPTPVGMNRLTDSCYDCSEHVPHACGDEPQQQVVLGI